MPLYYVKNGLVRGVATKSDRGFKWMPFTSARQPSRKHWESPDAAIKGRVSGGEWVEATSPREATKAKA